MKRIACMGIGIIMSLGLLSFPAVGQSSTQSQSTQSQSNSTSESGSSLGDYARQIKKGGPASKPKVFDNDNLPTNDKLSVVGAPAPPADNSGSNDTKIETSAAPAGETKSAENKAAETKAPNPAPTSSPEEDQAAKQALWKQWGEKVAAQKDQIDLLTRELNVLQKEYQIRAAAMYGDAGNRLRNEADWDKQDAQYKQQIADKQKALDDAKQKLDDMQEEARKAGVPSSFLGE
jgi:hypothetical protein